MNENAKFSWTSARCNRLLRPLSSKISLLRKITQSEPKRDGYNSGIKPPAFPQNSATTKNEAEWETSPRPWKKIKRTYSSRTNGQSFRGFVDHDKDRALQEASDAVIRLPLQLIVGRAVGHDKNSTFKDCQHDFLPQRKPPKAARGRPKKVQVLNGFQDLSRAFQSRLSNRGLIEGIFKALEALLQATICENTNNNSGRRSLFSTCLRQIPIYIAEEQCLIDGENPENDIDVGSEIYSDLEAFGSAPNSGCKSLREVVRADGVNLVREAIQEGLIELTDSRHILSLCLGLAAYDEAEYVIEGMIIWAKSLLLPPKGNLRLCAGHSESVNKWNTSHGLHVNALKDEASRITDALRYFVSRTGRYGFMYHQMAVMIEDGVLPVDWVSSKAMIDGWNGVIRSITQQDDHAQSAALLLQVVISKSYRRGASYAKASAQIHELRLRGCEPTTRRPILRSYESGQKGETVAQSKPNRSREASARPDDRDNALRSTLSNILTVLSAISILRSSELGLDSSDHDLLSVAILRDIALEIRQALELADITCYADCSWSVPATELRLPLLSAGLVSVASREAGTACSPSEVLDLATLASLPSSKESVCGVGSFLSEVARCCDSAGSGDGFPFIKIMVEDLISIAVSDAYNKPTRIFCNIIANAAALAFSEDTGQPRHLDWALDVEDTTIRTVDDSPKAVVNRSPARAVERNKGEYKWEEGICEWIARTPALALHKSTAVEDFDYESTWEEAPMVMQKQALLPLPAISPCASDRRLHRPKRRSRRRGTSCDSPKNGNVKGTCGKSVESEKLLFIRISPRPETGPRRKNISMVDVAKDFDELSTPESSQGKAIALREVPNPPCGVRRKSLGGRYHDKALGSLDMSSAKRHLLDIETLSQDTQDELGLP